MTFPKVKKKAVPYIFLLPNMAIFLIYIIIPAAIGVYYSFTNFDGLNDPKWIGVANYVKIFTRDRKFISALLNTIKYTAVTVPIIFVIALVLALIITQKIIGKTVFRASYYWPVMISFIVIGVMWQWILGDTFGIFNFLMEKMGIGKIATLTSKEFAWWAAVLIMVHARAGYYMLIFVGGLLSIPDEIYEASRIDGANKVQKFFYVTFPMLRPTSILVLIMSTVHIFKVYPLIVSFTGGGPYNATRFIVQHIYEAAFQGSEIGAASAMSVVALMIVTLFSAITFVIGKRTSYE